MTYGDNRSSAEIFAQELSYLQRMKTHESSVELSQMTYTKLIDELINEFYINTTQLSDFMYEYPDKSRIFIYNYKDNWIAQVCH